MRSISVLIIIGALLLTSSTIVPVASGQTMDPDLSSISEIDLEFDFIAVPGADGSSVTLDGSTGTMDDMGLIVPCSNERVVLPQGDVTIVDIAYTFDEGESLGPLDLPRAMCESPISEPAEPSYVPAIDRPMVIHGDIQRSRGVNLLDLMIVPFTVGGPADGIVFHDSIEVTISVRVTEDPQVLVDPDLDMMGEVVNPTMLQTYVGTDMPTDDSYDLLILTNNAMKAEFQRLVDHRAARGVESKIICVDDFLSTGTTSVNDDQDRIRNCIYVEYSFNGISYVLLGGDDDVIPHRGMYGSVNEGGTIDEDIPADIYYAGLDGEWDDDGDSRYGEVGEGDLYAEVYLGRAPVSTSIQARDFVDKVIAYENDPLPSIEALFIGQKLDDGPTWGGDSKDTMSVPYGMSVTRLYERDGTYSKSAVIDAINDGVGIVNNAGHGNNWYLAGLGTSDIDSFENDECPIWFSHGCYCGSFDNRDPYGSYGGDSIGERIVYDEDAAVAFVGNSRYGWYSPGSTDGACDRFDRAFFDQVCQGNLMLGRTLQDAKESLAFASFGGAMRWVYYDMNLLGDPCMTIRNVEPTGIEIISPSAGEVLYGGRYNDIGWSHADEPTRAVSIYLYEGDGVTTTLASNVADNGIHPVYVPDSLIGRPVRVLIVDSDDPLRGGMSPYVMVDVEPDGYEDDDSMAESHGIEFGRWYTHSLGVGDDDWCHFTVDAYDSVTINGTSSPDDDIVFEVVPDGGGDPIESHRYGQGDGWDGFYSINLGAGTYHLHTHCYDEMDFVGLYSLKVDRARILSIVGEEDLAAQASARGWSGSGTFSDPIVIAGLDLDAGDLDVAAIISNVGSTIVLRDIDVQSDGYGIGLVGVDDVTIDGCSIDRPLVGVYCPDDGVGSITIKDSRISHRYIGILAQGVDRLDISGCEIECRDALGEEVLGVHMDGVNHSSFSGNSFLNCTLVPSWLVDDYHDNLDGMSMTDDNTVDGDRIVFLKDQSDVDLRGDVGMLIAYRSNGIRIEAPSSMGSDFPVQMTLCDDVDILSLECEHSVVGVHMTDCVDVDVSASTFINCTISIMADGVDDCSFTYNRIEGEGGLSTDGYAIAIEGSGNEISSNMFLDRDRCVLLGRDSSNSVVTGNDFFGTTHNQDLGTGNSWSSNGRGNHWSEWTTPDANVDGVVDDPFTVFSDGVIIQDAFPLVEPLDLGLLHITGPVDDQFAVTTVTIYWESNGPPFTRYQVRVDDVDWTEVSGTSWTTPTLTEGEHTAEVRPMGHTTSDPVSFTVDLTSPTIVMAAPEGLINDPDPTVSWSVTDGNGLLWVRYQMDGVQWIDETPTGAATLHPQGDGRHTVTVASMDLAGNLATVSMTFDLDTTRPTVTYHSPTGDREDFVGIVNVAFDEEMDTDSLSVTLDGDAIRFSAVESSGVTTLTFDYDVEVGASCNIRVVGSDTAGNALRPSKMWTFGTRDYCVIDGTVKGEDGGPLVGARVSMDGQSVSTDQSGSYSLRASTGNHTMTVSMDGHVDVVREMVVTGDESMSPIAMEESTILDAIASVPGMLAIVLVITSVGVGGVFLWRRSG